MKPATDGLRVPARRAEAGFTLAELAVVMIIFGIVAAIALPGFNRFLRTLDLNGEVQATASMLRVVRQRAVTENNNYCVYYNSATKKVVWFDDDNNDGVKEGTEKTGSSAAYPSWLAVTQSVSNPFSADTLVFYPNGSTNTSGSLIYENTDGYFRSLSVVRPTGMVTVQ